MDIVIIAPLSALSKRLRLTKIANLLHSYYKEAPITHVGWEREPGEKLETSFDFRVNKKNSDAWRRV